ncbi:MAG: cupin domain-containing protein, partial [Pseudomonadota bacterium]
GQMEWYEIGITPKGALISSAHKAGTWEHLTSQHGHFEVTSDGKSALIGPGDTVRYRADTPHSIKNPKDAPAEGLLVVVSA